MYWKELTAYIEATNLLDEKYIDVGSINQAERWLSLGIKYKFIGF